MSDLHHINKAMTRDKPVRRWFRRMWRRIHPACPECDTGRVFYSGEDWTGRIWMSVYQCDRCGRQFI